MISGWEEVDRGSRPSVEDLSIEPGGAFEEGQGTRVRDEGVTRCQGPHGSSTTPKPERSFSFVSG